MWWKGKGGCVKGECFVEGRGMCGSGGGCVDGEGGCVVGEVGGGGGDGKYKVGGDLGVVSAFVLINGHPPPPPPTVNYS